jgi:hypothetical protein
MDGNPKRWTLPPKLIQKDLCGLAVRTAGANKDFEIRDWFPGLDP